MDYRLISSAVLALFALIAVFAVLLRRANLLLHTLVVALSVGGFNIYASGTIWAPSKILYLASTVYVLLIDHRWIALTRRYAPPLVTFVGAIVLSTCVAYVIEPQLATLGSGAQSRTWRPVAQAFAYLSYVSVIPLALVALRTEEDIRSFFSVYLGAAALSCVVALVQLGMVSAGMAFMPILRMTGEDSEMAAFQMGGILVQRLYAFAGEPKSLAAFLVPACCIVVAALKEGGKQRLRWASAGMLVVLLLVTLLTFSTAGLIAVAIAVPSVLLAFGRMKPLAVLRLVAATATILVVASFGFDHIAGRAREVSIVSASTSGMEDALYERSVGRLTDEIGSRDETRAFAYVSTERPTGIPLGLGPGMYNFHLPWMHWGRGIQPIDSGWTVLVLDFGIVGTGLLALWIFAELRRGRMASRRRTADGPSSAGIALASAALIGSACVNLGTGGFQWICLFLGAAGAARHAYLVQARRSPMLRQAVLVTTGVQRSAK